MSGNSLDSNFAPETLYANFEQFLEGNQGMVRQYGMDYAWVHMLVRLARDDLEKARQVFNWSVRRVCVNMLADERFRPMVQTMSPQGLMWARRAEETFGRNPLRSIGMVEGIYLLERLGVWAEMELQSKFHDGQTLAEFRKRPESNAEISGKIAWLDLFYQQARARAIEDSERFTKRRDCAIALSITALAGGRSPVDEEIDEALTQIFPTHQSLARHAQRPGSLVDQDFVVRWTLGRHQKEIAF